MRRLSSSTAHASGAQLLFFFSLMSSLSSKTNLTLYIISYETLHDKIPVENHRAPQEEKERKKRRRRRRKPSSREEFIPEE
jgi:hypothetical protein